MRLKQYINEEEALIEDVIKDCKSFLDIAKGNYIYRGSYKRYDDFTRLEVRKDRKPTDTPLELHNIWNRQFKRLFGWNVRSEGIFVTGSHLTALSFGDYAYIVFPIGKFKFVWSPKNRDLTNAIGSNIFNYFFNKKYKKDNIIIDMWYTSGDREDISFEEWKEINSERIEKEMVSKAVSVVKEGGYIDKNLNKAIESENEISIKCKSYYVMNIESFEEYGYDKLL